MTGNRLAAICFSALFWLMGFNFYALAADPQPYNVVIAQTKETELNQALQDASSLVSLKDVAPLDGFGLVARAQADVGRLEAVLQSFGYYKGHVKVQIAKWALDDPALHEWLDQAPPEPPVAVSVAVETGPLFHWGKIEIRGRVPPEITRTLVLETGTPARAKSVKAARERLLTALHEAGYALAKVKEPVAWLRSDADLLDVVIEVDAGSNAKLGKVDVKGLQRVDSGFVERRLQVKSGQAFNPMAIEKARQDLSALGVFSSVRARIAEQLDANGRLPITFAVNERPRHALSLGANYSTDVGGNLSSAWQHRNVLGQAELLQLSVGVTQLGGNSTTGIGYNGAVTFTKPDFWRRDQMLQISLAAVQEYLLAYDQTAVSFDVLLNRRLSGRWRVDWGITGEQSQIAQAGVTRDYTLLSLPMTLKYDSTQSLFDPHHGARAALTLTPTQSFAGSRTAMFAQVQAAASWYGDLTSTGRSVLALRGLVADTGGVSQFDLPPDQRTYAGGSATVRGYKFQSIGPRFADDTPQGGTAMAAASVEIRQRLFGNWGATGFIDAGQVSAGLPLFGDVWRLGAGLGARYYTSFGPIRLDVALPLNPQSNSSALEVYIGLGQAF